MLTDELLAGQTLRGDTLAFEELINRYKKSVFAIVYRMTNQYQEAEDIAQEVFLTVYQKLYQYDQSKSFGPWIHRIAINHCISSLRKKNKIISLNFDETFKQYEINASYQYEDPELAFERKELTLQIQQAINELPDTYRIVIILRFQMDYSNQEIADILGISKENVEVKVHRARKALRKIILRRWNERGIAHELPAN